MEKNNNKRRSVNELLFVFCSKKICFHGCLQISLFSAKDSVTRTELNHNRIYDPIEVKKIICEDVPGILQSCAEKAYLNTCVNVYNSLVLARTEKIQERSGIET